MYIGTYFYASYYDCYCCRSYMFAAIVATIVVQMCDDVYYSC